MIIIGMVIEIITIRKNTSPLPLQEYALSPDGVFEEEELYFDPYFDIFDILNEKSQTTLPLETVPDWNAFLDSIADKNWYTEPFYDLHPLQFDVYALEVMEFLDGTRETAPEIPEKLSH